MKLPLSWLREWVDVPWPAPELAERLTMLGLEVEGIRVAAPPFSGVVVAEIVGAAPHPQAEKLRVCQVSAGAGEPLQIVCGAPNARVGLRTALARVGARLPNGMEIGQAQLRGVESRGMLCSAKELGLGERGFRLVFNSGDDAGYSVYHIHLHLVGGRPLGWPPG